MAFTDVEMAILSQCAYYSYPDSAEKQTLYEFLKKNKSKLEKDLGSDYSAAIKSLMDKVQGQPYTIVKTMNDKHGTGFAAFAIQDPNNEVTVACRGTEGFSLDYDSKKDVYADVQLAYTLQTGQQEKLQEFLRDLEKGNYDGYYFTGHSLGGNLAMYGAFYLSDPNKLKGCITFNAPGFNSAFLALNQKRISRVEDRLINYQNERDCVSESFTVPGKVVILECKGLDFLNIFGVNAHGLNMFEISDDGKSFKKNHTGMKDVTIVGLLLKAATTISDIFMLAILPGIVLYDFFIWGISKIEAWVESFSKGAKYAASNPKVTVDTYKLKKYAQRLQSVNKRLSGLDSRIDSLYWKVGLLDLWNLMRSDFRIGYSIKVNSCANYLNDTASEFEKNEEAILSQI